MANYFCTIVFISILLSTISVNNVKCDEAPKTTPAPVGNSTSLEAQCSKLGCAATCKAGSVGPTEKPIAVSLEIQCNKIGYAKACESDNVCKKLKCRHSLWVCMDIDIPVLSGTPCGKDKFCKDGKCV